MKNRALKNPQLTKNPHNKPNEPIPTKKPHNSLFQRESKSCCGNVDRG